ncbi:hypothetical protein LP420_02740 [Massilia sp. B-10]|nr:hypothetical protein LP420_02740 [Massilia sp. B-10]
MRPLRMAAASLRVLAYNAGRIGSYATADKAIAHGLANGAKHPGRAGLAGRR